MIASAGTGGEAPAPANAIRKVDGRSVHLILAGPREAVPAILLHGGGFDTASLSWGALIGPLSAHRAVVAPDWPGHGASEARTGGDALPDLVSWLERFLDALGIERADFCGLSMGGGAALLFALDRPERVRRLVLVSSYGIARRAPLHPLSLLASRLRLGRLTRATMRAGEGPSRLLVRAMFHDPSRLDATLVREARQAALGTPGLAAFARFVRAEMAADGFANALVDRLPSLAAPTLLVHGRHDRLIPASCAEEAAATIPDARLVLVDTGHWAPREDPASVNGAIVPFLAQPYPACC